MKKKTLAVVVALVLVLGCAIGGTLAWLTDTTDAVVNTFTVGDINITLAESESLDLKMVPGNTITKDPKVTVVKDSEACWLFVKIEESDVLDTYISYTVADGWTQLTDADDKDVEGVYYREVGTSTADQEFDVLTGNKVTVNNDVTKAQMEALNEDGATPPTLTFTAYAVQKDNLSSAFEAWGKIA